MRIVEINSSIPNNKYEDQAFRKEKLDKVRFVFESILFGAILILGSALTGVGLFVASTPVALMGTILALVGIAGIAIKNRRTDPSTDSSPHSSTAIDLLRDIKKQVADANIQSCIERVEKVFRQKTAYLSQTYELHSLHHDLTTVTDHIKGSLALSQIWKKFLDKIEQNEVVFPDRYHMPLNCSFEKLRLEGKVPRVEIERIAPTHPGFAQDIHQIVQLERECFTSDVVWSYANLFRSIAASGSSCYVARKEGSQEILGVIWGYRKPDGQFHICAIARKAGAAKLRIGEGLMDAVTREQPACILEVRQSNQVAIHLYQKFGFVVTGVRPSYYQYPTEAALVMQKVAAAVA